MTPSSNAAAPLSYRIYLHPRIETSMSSFRSKAYWPEIDFDEKRYVYLGDTWDQLHDPDRCGTVCDAVLRGDGSDRVLRGRNRNQAVRFPNGDIEIVPGARLRLKETFDPEA